MIWSANVQNQYRKLVRQKKSNKLSTNVKQISSDKSKNFVDNPKRFTDFFAVKNKLLMTTANKILP